LRSDGARVPCDVALVAGGAWSAPLLAKIGVRLPFRSRGLQMLLTDLAPATLTPVIGCFGRPLSLKQLADGAYLIGGGWPARVPTVGDVLARLALGLDMLGHLWRGLGTARFA